MRFAIAAALIILATPAWANTAPAPPEITFTATPTWVPVEGTDEKVLMIQAEQRPKYDIFSLGGKYYVYKQDTWFRSDALNGPYALVATDAVPVELHKVPKESWVVYPTNWGSMGTSSGPGSVYGGSYGQGMTGSAGTVTSTPTSTTVATTTTTEWTPTISFAPTPKWITVPGSAKVYYVDKSARPTTYDLYRYDSRYYTYQKDNWYVAQSVNGPYTIVASSDGVPTALRTVKKTYWVSYPSGWTYITPSSVNAMTKTKVEIETR